MATYGMIGLLIRSLALISNIVGLALPFWLYYKDSGSGIEIMLNTGLWKICSSTCKATYGVKEEKCKTFQELHDLKNYPDLPSEFNVSRALEILAVLLTAAALVVACVKVFVKKDKGIFMVFAGGSAFLAGLLMIAGTVVFVTSDAVKRAVFGNSPLHFIAPHAGFALCIFAGVISIATAIVFFVDAKQYS